MKASILVVLLALYARHTAGKRSGSLPLSRPSRDGPPRGGGAVKPLFSPTRVPIELNPNYVPPPPPPSQTRKNGPSMPFFHHATSAYRVEKEHKSVPAQVDDVPLTTSPSPLNPTAVRAGSVTTSSWSPAHTSSSSSSSWMQNVPGKFLALYRASPALALSMVSCVAVFLAWQVAPHSPVLRHYFILSRHNVLQAHRWPSLLLSAVSHYDFWHLLVNLYGLWSFGPAVQQALRAAGRRLGPFLGGAALASSTAFLLLQNFSRAGGALGLSGVTLALTAVYARMYPQAKLGVRIGGIFPVQVKAENLLICMTAWSFLGSFSRLRSDIGHAAHLGGLLFGVAYHALFLRPRRHHHHQQQQLYFAYQ